MPAAPGPALTRLVVAAIVIGLIGRSVELTLPLVLSSAAAEFGLSSVDLGLFAMAEVLGVTLASATSFLWAARLSPFSTALTGLAAFAAGNLITPFVPVEWLVPVRFATACFGEGLLLVVATSLLGTARSASRIYSVYMAAQMLFGAALLATQGQLAAGFGFVGVMLSLVALAVTAVLALPALRRRGMGTAAAVRPASRGVGRTALGVLAGMGVFHVGVGGAWAFLQQRGGQLGLDFSGGGWTLGAIMASGIVGNAVAAILGARAGLQTPLLAGAAGLGVGGALVGLGDSVVSFVAGGIVLMIAWNLSVPYQIALLAAHDRSPARLGLVPAFQGAGLAAGPMAVGVAAGSGNYASIALLGLLAALISAVLFALGRAPAVSR